MKLGDSDDQLSNQIDQRKWMRLPAAIRSKTFLAVLDQGIVSGSRFFTSVFVGRLCGKDELGMYALTFAIYLLFACTQEALISTPYTVFSNRLNKTLRRTLSGSVLLHNLTLSLGGAILTLLTIAIIRLSYGYEVLHSVIMAMAIVLPATLLWEFSRRFAIAHLQFGNVLVLDTATAISQVMAISCLAWQDSLAATTAYLALGVGAGLPAATFCWLRRAEFQFDRRKVVQDWTENWQFGRWVLSGQIIGLVQGFCPAWVLLFAIDEAATGVFSACTNIVLLSNPLILAMANLYGATTARAYADGGPVAVRRVVRSASILGVSAMLGLWIFLSFFGGRVVELFYGGEFSGNGELVGVIAFAAPFWAFSCCLSVGLRALGRPDAELGGRIAGFVITLVFAILLVGISKIVGVAWALVAGAIATTAWQAWAFYCWFPEETAPKVTSELVDERA